MDKALNIIKNDPWLEPYADAINGRHQHVVEKEKELVGKKTLSDFATGHMYFGLHRTDKGWTFREWAPNATHIYMVGTFNNWEEKAAYKLKKLKNGNWEINLPADAIHHGDLYKLNVYWEGGQGERIPAWATRVVQDEQTKIFSAQVWAPEKPYKFKKKTFKPDTNPLLIYECHIGMAQREEKVGTYNEFREKILPRIAEEGYNCIQIMAIQEHPYYGSFGYHVSSFFAASSRFGTPDELKALIDAAHEMGIAVIMDIVHSHAVKNEVEGLGNFAGDPNQYFYPGVRREHPAWDSLCFDYGKNEVIHFLLSNCKYWLEEYKFDGFRFDGVTSMLYFHRGHEPFGDLGAYFGSSVDLDAVAYLQLAATLIQRVKPGAIAIAEDMSGMPGLCRPVDEGGIGFSHRLAMGIPDYWIKLLKEKKDEEWSMGDMWHTLTNRRYGEPHVAYCESHDQALVGDKTLAFRLMDAEMYWKMAVDQQSLIIDRGMALHKMIRLVTLATGGEGWLNFMGNEFGHPEWIDFPREGNGWSYEYCRRQWSLVDNPSLRFKFLNAFDQAMVRLAQEARLLNNPPPFPLNIDETNHVMAFHRGGLVFVFNWSGDRAIMDYMLPVPQKGEWRVVLDTDNARFGGFGRQDVSMPHFTDGDGNLSLYLLPRTALVLKRVGSAVMARRLGRED